MSHLSAFTIHDLAQISDWLDEKGELCINIDRIGHNQSADRYFIRSLRELRLLVRDQANSRAMIFTIYRDAVFSVRGLADRDLLEQVLQVFPQGKYFYVVSFAYYPTLSYTIGEGSGHFQLLSLIEQEWGKSIAISHDPLFWDDNIDGIETIEVWTDPLYSHFRKPAYAPYNADPARYQWIIDMWQE